MTRLAWALVLAFVAHLVVFLIQLPEQEDTQLILAGSNQVSVRLTRSRPEPVQEKVAPDSEPARVPAVEPEGNKIIKAVAESVAAQVLPSVETTSEQEIQDAGEIQEVERKAVSVPEEQAAVAESSPAPDVNKQRTAAPALSASAADGSESAGSTNPVTRAVRQAEPLAAENRPPAYPALARRRGWQGKVMLEVEVDPGGLVKEVRIKTSSSYSLLDREAMAAVRKWRFTPGTRNGIPIPSKVLVPVLFKLQGN